MSDYLPKVQLEKLAGRAIASRAIGYNGPRWWVFYRAGTPEARGLANIAAAVMLHGRRVLGLPIPYR